MDANKRELVLKRKKLNSRTLGIVGHDARTRASFVYSLFSVVAAKKIESASSSCRGKQAIFAGRPRNVELENVLNACLKAMPEGLDALLSAG